MDCELMLIEPTEEYLNEVASYKREFLDAGDSMDGAGPLRRSETPEEWLRLVRSFKDPETVPEKWVASTQFICVRESDRRIVGMIQVRHTLNDFLRRVAGHIGYSVRPSERGRGYAKWMLKNVLPYCRSIGLDRVMVSCGTENEASRRTILANGGVFDGTALDERENMTVERYWIDLK
ncbi:MAG: GNAT family N-acetyltransferase [Clostridia bacterium]|nr:GNAT family N-acetyltransferase [Clostridia bacterium]